jgi:hypothetical protein
MKKQTMSLAVASALLVGGSGAFGQMYLNERGTGEALIFPYYSAAEGNDTYIHVVNTTDKVKAVKVRFLEAQNSTEVLDFNLYLSPQDHWSAAITADENGAGGAIVTVDTSCTVPALGQPNGGFDGTTVTDEDTGVVTRTQPFVNFAYEEDEGNTGIERSLQGYVEMIEMGQFESGTAPANFDPTDLSEFEADTANDKGFAATHNAQGVPNGCGKLVAAWSTLPQGDWTVTAGASELLATWDGGGLYGYGTLINVEDGTAAGYDAVAIDAFVDPASPAGAIHEEPGDVQPNLDSGVPVALVVDAGVATEYAYARSFDAASALFMAETVSNDFIADTGLRARTDWILTQPTKRAYVDGAAAVAPYTNVWDGEQACEAVDVAFWDREELVTEIPPSGANFSPRPGPDDTQPDEFTICTEVAVVGFGADSAVRATDDIFYGFSELLSGVSSGWARIDLTADTGHVLTDDNGAELKGLPVTGFAAITYRNDDANEAVPGVLASYAATTEHKTTVTAASS